MTQNERGSTWKKCDLHFHTPKSYDYNYKEATAEELVRTLIDNGIELVAVTDHHVIDPKFIKSMRKYSNGKLSILPGVELRSDLGDNVHFILIFSEENNLDKLSVDMQALTGMYENVSTKTDHERCIVPKDKISEIAKKYGALVSVHAGDKHHSIETIKNGDEHLKAAKIKTLRDLANMLEVNNYNGINSYRNIVFPSIGFDLPLVSGSDNHDIRIYEQKMECWINCDATFRGLQQVVIERQERISIGKRPDILARIDLKPQIFFEKLSIRKKESSKLKDVWFDNIEIPLNPGLVCIIGNKGNGKSALSDIIAVLSKSKIKNSDYSFLNTNKFCNPKYGKARHFFAEISYLSGEVDKIDSLEFKPDIADREKATYIPQRYLENICNEIGTESEFQEILKRVIFSHIHTTDRHNKETLDELIKFKTSEIERNIDSHKLKLKDVCSELQDAYIKDSQEYKEKIASDLRGQLAYLKVLCKRKPAAVAKPAVNQDDEKLISIVNRINKLKKEKEELEARSAQLSKDISLLSTQTEDLKRIQEKLGRLDAIILKYRDEVQASCLKADFPFERISIPRVEYGELLPEIALREKLLASHRTQLSEENEEGYPSQIEKLKKALGELEDQLAAPQRVYQQYQTELASWRTEVRTLLGDRDTPSTVRYVLKKQLEARKARQDISDLFRKLNAYSVDIFREISTLKSTLESLNEPIKKSISKSIVAKEHALDIGFECDYSLETLQQVFFDFINHARVGSYYSTESAQLVFTMLSSQFSIETVDDALGLVRELICSLSFDVRNESEFAVRDPFAQLKSGVSWGDLLYKLYSFDYIRPEYQLSWRGKPIGQLSPGERGTLLLVFFLILDLNDKPLILDQPEDNLDNHTIYKALVPCIKEAKKRRQIIIVTHNPNIAVVCDSDQIIHTSIDKSKNNRIIISSGSIESPHINKAIIDILEGTLPAFAKREQKYLIDEH